MGSYREKLSILSEMIAFAQGVGEVKSSEYNFLLNVAGQLGVSQEVFESLFEQQIDFLIPKTQAERIVQFHRLVLLMNVDQLIEDIEVRRLHNMGLSMGLPPSAIEQVLTVMHQYPNKVIPPNVLIDIFKVHYN